MSTENKELLYTGIIILKSVQITKSHRVSERKNYDAHPFMQKVGKFNFEINVIPDGLVIEEF